MSSSSNYRSSQLHRVSLHSNGKRPFEECGYDSDPDTSLNSSTQASGSGSSASSRHFPSSSTSSSSGEGRNKRARSTSSSSNSDLSSSSDVSTSTGYDTAPSSSRSDLIPSGPSPSSRNAVDCPVPAPAMFDPQEGVMSDLSIELPRPAFTTSVPTTTASSSEDSLRSSLERFNEFERQIAALRSSFAASRPPLPSQMGSSEHAHEEWHAMSSGFLSTGLSTSDASDDSVHLVPTDSFSSPPAVQSTSGVPASLPPASSASNGLYSAQHSSISRSQVYRPPLGARQSVGQGHSGVASASYNSTLPTRMASTTADIGVRQPTSGPVSSPPPSPQLRPVRRSPSPLILDPVVSSYSSDDSGILGDRDVSSDQRPPVSRRTTDSIFPESSLSFVTRSDSHTLRASPEPIEARHRVIRQHSAERAPTPSVFDVFGIEDSLPHRNASGRGSPPRERSQTSTPFQVDPRVVAESEPGRLRGRTTSVTTLANRPNFHSRLYSMPSTNSLMSENAAEHRHIMAREQMWSPLRRHNGLEVTDHDDDSPSDASSRSEVILVPNRGEFGQGDRPGPARSVVPATHGGREPGGVRRPETRLEAVRPFVPRPPSPFPDPMVSHAFEPLSEFFATDIPTSSGSHRIHRETSSPTDEWSTPYAGQRHQQQAPTATSYSYTSLNLDSFQSGMFRDSLQRSADVHRPTISRQFSWNVEEDSDSSDDMDFGIMRPPQPSSPPLRDRLRAFATGIRSQRDAIAALDRTEPTPSSVNDERMAFRERQQDVARGPGPTVFGRQSIAGGTQPSNVSYGGNRGTASRVMDPIRGQRDESRRRPISTLDTYNPPGPNLNRALRPVTPDDEPVARRPFAGGILQRLANMQRSSDNVPPAPSSQPGSRGVPPPPVGGRPTLTRYRRVTLPDAVHDDDAPLMGRISLTPAPTSAASEMPRREGVPWRSFISGLRGPEAADSASGPPVIPTRAPPPPEERSSRLRSLRQRVQLDRGDGSMPRRPGVWRSAAARRNFPSADYVPDELFDPSYEALLSLSNAIGEVRSKATPEDVIASLPSATYKEWAKDDSETRCPICLDDYEPFDMVTKLLECPHWLHKHCLEQWLRTANTCPVCRKKVKTSDTSRKTCPHQRAGNANMSAANIGPSQNNLASLPSRPLPSISYSSIPPPPNFLHSTNLARAAAVSRRPRPGRAETLPGASWNTALDEENYSHDYSRYVYEDPHYDHAPHLDSHLTRAPVPRPSHLQRYTNAYPPQPQSYIHGPVREGYERFSQRGPGPTTEQLFLPLTGTSPSDQIMDSRSRPVFPSVGTSTLDVGESPQQIPQPGLGSGSHTTEPARSSMVASASSVMFTAPQSSPPNTSRADASSITITNSTSMVVTNRLSTVYPRTTNFSIEHANTPHHHVHAGPPSQAPHGSMLHLTEGTSRAQDTSGRWHVHTSSTFLRDRPSSGESGMYPWWE